MPKKKQQRAPAWKRRLARIGRHLDQQPGELTDEFLDDVLVVIEAGKEDEIYALEHQTGADILDIAIQEAGYRLLVSLAGDESVMIPFALMFQVAIPLEEQGRFPVQLPRTIDQAAAQKLIRRLLLLDETPSLLLDPNLYWPGQPEWLHALSVRRYLGSCLSLLNGRAAQLEPLGPPLRPPASLAGDAASLESRVLCGIILAPEAQAMALEDRLLGEEDNPSWESELWFRPLAALIEAELESQGINLVLPVSFYPMPLELWEVPQAGAEWDIEYHLLAHGIDPEIIYHRRESLLQAVLGLEGDKILTLSLEGETQAFDINRQGVIGYHPSHGVLLETRLLLAITTSGSLIVRQFLPLQTEQIDGHGQRRWFPRKNVYGIHLGGGTWEALPAETMKQAACTDARDGSPLPPEPGVSYKSLPVSLA